MESSVALDKGERPVSDSSVDVRADFITKTYTHLFGAIIAFTMLEIVLFQSGFAQSYLQTIVGLPKPGLIIGGAFVLVSWFASHAAGTARSLAVQYLALTAFVVAEAVVFIPLLWFANVAAPGTIQTAAYITLGGFAALTGIAFYTRKDFSFLGALLSWIGVCALLAILASLVFGFTLGPWFAAAMVAFAGGCVLYDTSNVIHHYPADRYVAASLALFSSVAMMFYYVLRLLSSRR